MLESRQNEALYAKTRKNVDEKQTRVAPKTSLGDLGPEDSQQTEKIGRRPKLQKTERTVALLPSAQTPPLGLFFPQTPEKRPDFVADFFATSNPDTETSLFEDPSAGSLLFLQAQAADGSFSAASAPSEIQTVVLGAAVPVSGALSLKERQELQSLLIPLGEEAAADDFPADAQRVPLSQVPEDIQKALAEFLADGEAEELDGQFVFQQTETLKDGGAQQQASQKAVVSFRLSRTDSGALRLILEKETALGHEYTEMSWTAKEARKGLSSLLYQELAAVKDDLLALRQQAATLLVQNLWRTEKEAASLFLETPKEDDFAAQEAAWWQNHPLKAVAGGLKYLPVAAALKRWRDVLADYPLSGLDSLLTDAPLQKERMENLQIEKRVEMALPRAAEPTSLFLRFELPLREEDTANSEGDDEGDDSDSQAPTTATDGSTEA